MTNLMALFLKIVTISISVFGYKDNPLEAIYFLITIYKKFAMSFLEVLYKIFLNRYIYIHTTTPYKSQNFVQR